jgi:hypothetical protein
VSLYTAGIGGFLDDARADIVRENEAYSRELQGLIRTLNSTKRTGNDIIAFLRAVASLRSRYSSVFTLSTAEQKTADAQLAEAVKNPASIGITSMVAPYAPSSSAYSNAIRLATRVVASSSAASGVQKAKVAAVKDIPAEVARSVAELPQTLGKTFDTWFWVKAVGIGAAGFALYKMLTDVPARALPPWVRR